MSGGLNLMRAALANGALTCGWAGRPHWFLHPMAMGATIGHCLRLTQNNSGEDYQPAGDYYNASQGVFRCAKRRAATNQDRSVE